MRTWHVFGPSCNPAHALDSLCHVMLLSPAAAALPGCPARWRHRASSRAVLPRCSSSSGGYYALREDDFLLSQASGVTDTLFKGDVLGVDADVATTDFRSGLATLQWLDSRAFFLPPRLADAVALHVAKCFLGVSGAPLVLAVWGPKGTGKTLGVQLACKALGVTPFTLQAADLEDSTAGEPGLRLRSRYAAAVSCAATSGTPTALVIDDLDTGIGRYKNTGRTINAQTVAASLMALCDAPSSARRVPVIVTAADVSRLYAPLLRDGRMAKLLWQPTGEEMRAIIQRVFDIDTADAAAIEAAFPGRGPDFYGAIHNRMWDASLSEWMDRHGGPEHCGAALTASFTDAGIDTPRQPGVAVAEVVAAGRALETEAEWFASLQLSRQYLRWSHDEPAADLAAPKQRDAEAAAQAARAAQQAQQALALAQQQAAAAADAMYTRAREAAAAMQQAEHLAAKQVEASAPPPAAACRWQRLSALEAKRMMDEGAAKLVDIRSAKEHDKSTVRGAVSVPSYIQKGSSLAPELVPLPTGQSLATALAKKVPQAQGVTRILMGPDPGAAGEALAAAALEALVDAGVEGWAELEGGYAGWSARFTSMGVPKQRGAFPRSEFDFWTASN